MTSDSVDLASGATEVALWDLAPKFDQLFSVVDVADKRVVDVGAGEGSLVRLMIGLGADAIGVECGDVMLERAHAADPEHPERYLDGVGQDLPIEDASMDLVVFSSSLHHVPVAVMADALSEADRVLVEGGVLCVLEPVAAGAGYETHRPIDDEAQVRAAAQASLDNDLPARLVEQPVVHFDAAYRYADLDDLRHTVVGIDPDRAAVFDQVSDEVARRFASLGVEHDGATWFPQPMILRRFVAS